MLDVDDDLKASTRSCEMIPATQETLQDGQDGPPGDLEATGDMREGFLHPQTKLQSRHVKGDTLEPLHVLKGQTN